jgi:hypothetical protein
MSQDKQKICYIVLTCEKYISTRVKWQNETFFKNVKEEDVFFLSCKKSGTNIYGWDTEDNYESCPSKYIAFFKNMTIDYDWYCFIDDDTFINTNNLNEYLKKLDSNKTSYIGRLCLNYSPPFYMSGGAGFILSKKTYVDLLQYIKNTDKIDLLQSIYSDLSVGLWIKKIKDVEYINNDNFNPTTHNKSSDLNEFISFHYLKTFEEFDFYYNLIK